jgi:hypothetical protein
VTGRRRGGHGHGTKTKKTRKPRKNQKNKKKKRKKFLEIEKISEEKI